MQIEAQTKNLGDNLRRILQKLKSIAVSRYVVQGNNQQSAEHDRLLEELDKVESQIKELIPSCQASIQANKNDIQKIMQGINMVLKGKADNGQAMAQKLMITAKESEIKFLEMQSKRLKDDLDFLYSKENNRYRYKYRVVQRKIENENKEAIYIQAWDRNVKQTYPHSYADCIMLATHNENGVFINSIRTSPKRKGIASLLYKAFQSLFDTGTIFYFENIENNSHEARLFWLKMGFVKKPLDGEVEAKYYWKRVP